METIKPVYISCFGTLSVRIHDQCIAVQTWNSPKVYELLLLLASSAEQAISKYLICDQLWPNHDADKAHQNLEFTLRSLRQIFQKHLGSNYKANQVIPLQQGKIGLNHELCDIDTIMVRDFIQQGRKMRQEKQYDEAYSLEQQIIGMIQEGFLHNEEGLVYQQRKTWHLTLCNWLDEVASHWQTNHAIPHQQIIALLDVALYINPYSERLLCQRMKTLHQAGYQADAITHYHSWVELLTQKFKVEPSKQTQQLYQTIAQA